MTESKQHGNVFNFSGGQKVKPEKSTHSVQETIAEIVGSGEFMDEFKRIVHEKSKLTVHEVGCAINDSEIGISQLFTKMFKNLFCFNTSYKEWLVYKDFCWHADHRSEHIDACRYLHKFLVDFKRDYLKGLSNEMEKFVMTEIKKTTHIGQMRNILAQAAAGEEGLGVVGEDFDKVLGKIGAPNGIIDLETGELLSEDPELYITKQVGAPYDPEAPDPELFFKFLREIFKYPVEKEKGSMTDDEFEAYCQQQCEALIEYVQTLFGYALLGTCKEHILAFFWGIGRNGKGVLVRAVIKAFGDYAGEINPAVLLSTKTTSAEAPNPSLVDLQGKRLAVASETNQAEFFNTSAVKRLTGGDTLVTRKPYAKDIVRFRPSHTLILQTNFRPNTPAEDDAFWKRIHVVPFHRRFVDDPDPENIYQAPIDRDLEDKLSQELPGILRWVVEGAIKYQKNGLKQPDCSQRAVEAYRASGDIMGDFIAECCVTGQDCRERTLAFVKAFNEWRKVLGYNKPMSFRVVTERLEYKGFIKKKSSNKYYLGLMLNNYGMEYLKPVGERRTHFENDEVFIDPGTDNFDRTECEQNGFTL